MATNLQSAYGRDIACLADADELFSEVTGPDLVAQDCLHAITQEHFLGEGGDDRGIDVRDFIGMHAEELATKVLLVHEVITRDERIETVEVALTPTAHNGTTDVLVEIAGTTALGPFGFTKSVRDLISTIGDPQS